MILESIALLIVAVYVLFRLREHPQPRNLMARLALIALAGWVNEESCILLYRFYDYSPVWTISIAHVPLLVILIWPLVIHSAWDLVRQWRVREGWAISLATGAIVLTDASLIEPVAVQAGLWSWSEPGIFHVPPIGLLGWACFAALSVFFVERDGWTTPVKGKDALSVLNIILGTHFFLLISWWGGLRWISVSVGSAQMAITAWLISLLLVCLIIKKRTRLLLDKKALLLRLPAAVLCYLLFAYMAEGAEMLVIYAIAFVPPYLTLTRTSRNQKGFGASGLLTGKPIRGKKTPD